MAAEEGGGEMRTPDGCKLFGAQQALAGIQDGVILFHSVVGCNFGTMSLHVPADMRDIRQTCTVINDSDIIFSGEDSLRKGIRNALELFHPSVLFVVSGCVSEMIGDHIEAVVSEFLGAVPIVYVEAAGFRGNALSGYQAACRALLPYMQKRPASRKNVINLLGLGGDDYRLEQDIAAVQDLLGKDFVLQPIPCRCTWKDIENAPQAKLNLVFDRRGLELAEKMREQFDIPFEQLPFPYGITGAKDLCRIISRYFAMNLEEKIAGMEQAVLKETGRVYPYLQALYGMPAAIIGNGSRADGMRRFLEQELGMEVVCCQHRESLSHLEDFYGAVRGSEAALLFGSSFELDLAEELKIPLIRYDYPIFDEIALTGRPFAGAAGTPALLENILNKVLQTSILKGALYQ